MFIRATPVHKVQRRRYTHVYRVTSYFRIPHYIIILLYVLCFIVHYHSLIYSLPFTMNCQIPFSSRVGIRVLPSPARVFVDDIRCTFTGFTNLLASDTCFEYRISSKPSPHHYTFDDKSSPCYIGIKKTIRYNRGNSRNCRFYCGFFTYRSEDYTKYI